MIHVEQKNIRISHGDTLDLICTLKNFHIDADDVVVITIRGNNGTLQKRMRGISGDQIPMFFSTEEMNTLPPGMYRWDLLVKNELQNTTLAWPRELIIEGVVHDET